MSEWISVKDRLPEHEQAVIGCDKTGFITRFQFDAEEPPIWIDDHEEIFQLSEITHWMPLPEPPKEGDSNA